MAYEKIPLLAKHGVEAYVGGCVLRGEGSRFRAKAHTHTVGAGSSSLKPVVCFLSRKWITNEPLIIHELAHALTGVGHTDKWRKKVLELGGTIQEVPGVLRSYEKRSRS